MFLEFTRELFLNVTFAHSSTPNCICILSVILFTVLSKPLNRRHCFHITLNRPYRIGGLYFSYSFMFIVRIFKFNGEMY